MIKIATIEIKLEQHLGLVQKLSNVCVRYTLEANVYHFLFSIKKKKKKKVAVKMKGFHSRT